MITSRKLKGNPNDTANYHMGEENYYFSQGRSPDDLGLEGRPGTQEHVRIHGALAEHLGFSEGQLITREEFSNILAGKNASGVKVTREHKVHGIDLTFSAPKSVSVAALLTHRDPRILEAHQEAVLETMREIERVCAATRPRSDEHVSTGNLAYVTALDGYNREHEPHLHTHVIVTNMTLHEDRVLALDGQQIMARGFNRTWGTLYKTKLAANLKELGYDLTYMKKGEFRLDAVSLDVEKAFSGRRAEILELKARGKTDMQAWNTSRKEKDPSIEKEEVLAEWQRKLEQFEPKAPEVNRTEAVAARELWYQQATWSVEAKQELAGARETGEIGRWQLAAQRATQNAAIVSELEIIGEYLTELGRTETWNTATYAQAQAAFQAQVQAGHVIATDKGGYTTWEMMRADRECVVQRGPVLNLAMSEGDAEAGIEAYRRHAERTNGRPLSERQGMVALGLLTSGRAVDVVQGDAGSGKTTMLKAVNQIASEEGWEVVGVAVQGIAAQNLQDESGIRSTTLAAYLGQEERAEARGIDRAPRLVIFDEASMLGSRDGAEFLSLAERRGDKVVLVGDRNQLESVGAGKPFERLVEAAEDRDELLSIHDNWRQTKEAAPVLRAAVDMARQGRMRESLDHLEEHGLVVEIADKKLRWETVARQYGPDTLIMAGTQECCDELNRVIRKALLKEGELDAETNREYELVWRDADGVPKTEYRFFAVGDRIRFLQNDYRESLDVRNGECGEILEAKDRHLQVKLEDGRVIGLDLDIYSAIDHGYAVTTYKGQGQTFDKVVVEADTSLPLLQDQRNSYVQITRARKELLILTDDIEDLREAAGIMSSKQDTFGIEASIEEARRMEAHVEDVAKREAPVWGREAVAFGRATAEMLEGLVRQGEAMPEKGPDASDDDEKKRDEPSEEASTPRPEPHQPEQEAGGPARPEKDSQSPEPTTPQSTSLQASLSTDVASYPSSITAHIQDFNALFGEEPLEGTAETLRGQLRGLVAQGLTEEEALARRRQELEDTTNMYTERMDMFLQKDEKFRKIYLESFTREFHYTLLLDGHLPKEESFAQHERLRQSLLPRVLEPEQAPEVAGETAQPAPEVVEQTPANVPVHIYNEALLASAEGVKSVEKAALAEMKAVEDEINGREDLGPDQKLKLAALFNKPQAAELFLAGDSAEDRVAGAEIALKIRTKEAVFQDLSREQVQSITDCAQVAAMVVSQHGPEKGHGKSFESEGPEIDL